MWIVNCGKIRQSAAQNDRLLKLNDAKLAGRALLDEFLVQRIREICD